MDCDVTYKTSLIAVNHNNMLNKLYLYSDDSQSTPFCSVKLRTQKKELLGVNVRCLLLFESSRSLRGLDGRGHLIQYESPKQKSSI